ncbi:ATP-binding cassette sub-family A member 3-like [Folsomia candida]|nr:ATP-binding cassette sub-family A member 3-like [Folsomia candida]
MSGVNPFTFWASYLILDGLYVTVFAGVAVLIFFFAQERYLFTMHGGSVALFLIFLLGGFAVVCFGYFFSQVVNDAASSFVWLNMLHLLAVLGSHIMFRTHDGINDGVSELYFWLITPFPIPFMVHSFYVYGKVVIDNSRCELVAHHFSSGICKRKGLYIHLPAYSCCAQCNSSNCFQPRNYFDASYGYESYTLTRDLVIMGLVALIYFVLVVLMDYNYFQKLNRYFLSAPSEDFSSERGEKDPSAAQEAENVRRLIGLGVDVPDDEGLLVDNLCRNHGNIGEIYSQVSFDVKKGQCFGLLGLGDAKSLVFKTLTGEILPDVGDSVIPPYSMLRNRRQFTTNIGYCPQANCVFSGLTARETLQLYGSLKGICLSDLMTEVRQWLSALGLENDSNLLCGNFTPGMKRRLCVAVALIGNPQVIILDEPSRDIDPSMKKYIWGTLQRLQKDGKVILLASQNVHECENLCGKLGLMVHGRLQYVGSAREIKSRFLNGYTVTFKLTKRYSVDDASDLETVSDIKTSIEACLDDALFRDAFQNTLKYLIPQKTQNWGSIVERLEKIRTQLSASVAYYSMTESTLEEVFNAMDDLELESTNNELPGTRMTPFQRLCLGQCCTDDYS